MHWPTLLAFWAAFTLALISPGPNFALMLRIGLGSGRDAALRTTLGIAVGEAVWGFAALFGVAAVALRYPVLGTGIRWAGGAFLLWLAFGALRSAWRGGGVEDAAPAAAGGAFWTGLALMLLNAKAWPCSSRCCGMGRWRWPFPAAGSPRSTLARGVASKACWVRPWPRWA